MPQIVSKSILRLTPTSSNSKNNSLIQKIQRKIKILRKVKCKCEFNIYLMECTNIIETTFEIGPDKYREQVKDLHMILFLKCFDSLVEEKLVDSEI